MSFCLCHSAFAKLVTRNKSPCSPATARTGRDSSRCCRVAPLASPQKPLSFGDTGQLAPVERPTQSKSYVVETACGQCIFGRTLVEGHVGVYAVQEASVLGAQPDIERPGTQPSRPDRATWLPSGRRSRPCALAGPPCLSPTKRCSKNSNIATPGVSTEATLNRKQYPKISARMSEYGGRGNF